MRQGIAGGLDFPSSVDEIMAGLCGDHRIEHDADIPAGGIFHAGRHIHAADGQAVLLILHGPCAHGHIGKDI